MYVLKNLERSTKNKIKKKQRETKKYRLPIRTVANNLGIY